MSEEEKTNIEEEKKRKKREQIRKFESPVPFVIMLRNLVFGKKRPDIYTRITFYINLIIWFVFMLWSIIGLFALSSRDWIWQQKGVPVTNIIHIRGKALGLDPVDFMDRLLTFQGIAVICWSVVLFGLILLYRKSRRFIFFTIIPVLFYVGTMMFYITFDYFLEDTTTFDKIALLIFVVSLALHSFLLKNERDGGSISFFGEVPEDDEDIAE